MAMKYICFYHDYLEKFDQLSDEEAGRLTKAMLRYAVTGEITELGRVEAAFFCFIKGDIDRQQEQYARKCEKNRQNILRRYEKPTTVYDGMQDKDKEEDEEEYKDKDKEKYEYEHEEENEEKEEEEEKEKDTFTPPTLLDVVNYCKESGCETDVDMFLEYYDANDWKQRSGKPVKNWKAALQMWARRQKRYDAE